MGSLTRTLQTCHQDDGGIGLQVQINGLAAHQLCQFVVNDLDHQLTRLDGCKHVHAQSLLLHLVGEVLGNLIVYVGIEQRTTHVLESLCNIDFGDLAFTLEDFERALKTLR